MNSDQPRRAATIPLSVPQNHQAPPPAPPLPPQQRARNALNRFLGFPARTSDSDEDGSGTQYWAEANRATVGRLPSLSAHNASASHKTGLELNSLSINDEGTHALLAGREIFKTIRVEEGSCTEDVNLRSAIRSFDSHLGSGGPAKDGVNIHDVAWGKGNYGNFIAAATYNGPIVVYDLKHTGFEVARLNEHRRQVHRVTFNPHAGQHFLSGSQDGTVRLWDLRDLRRDSSSFSSRFTTSGQHEGVRDVKWSPTDVFALALCTDGGFVQRWDTRKLKTPLAKIAAHTRIAAHTSPCATIDWHPDGKHVLSASADKTVKVWNLSAESSKRSKPAYEIKTPHPLRNARWRPSCQSSLPRDRGARLCSQIVTSYEQNYDLLHIWDFRRPWLPFREIQGYRSAPTDLLWHSQDLLWTVGKEGMFLQHDVKFAEKVLDKRNLQAMAVSPLGDFQLMAQRRPGRPRPGLEVDESDHFLSNHPQIFDEKKGAALITGRGSADDSVEETFLSTSSGRKNGRQASSPRTPRSNGEPPTSVPPEIQQPPQNLRTMPLEDVLAKKRLYKPAQGTAIGVVPGAANTLLWTYFAQKYKTRPLSEPPSVESYLRVQEVFEENAQYAEKASMYRMAQSWRLAGQAVSTELRRRAIAHRQLRVKGNHPKKSAIDESPFAKRARKYLASERKLSSKPTTPLARPVKVMDNLQTSQLESTSNVPTPRAKPITSRPGSSSHNGRPVPLRKLSPDDEGLALPPSLISPERLQQQNLERDRQVSAQSWFHSAEALDERKAELSSWRAQSKAPLSLEPPSQSINLERHNSNDSFGMFPSISSRDASMPVSSVASMTSLMETVHENLKDASPHGSMNIGSSSSSEPNMTGSVFPQSFYSFPSAAVPPQQTSSDTAISSSAEDNQDELLNSNIKPVNQGKPTEIPPVRDIAGDVKTLAINNQLSFSSDSDALSSSVGQRSKNSEHPDSIPEDTSIENMEASGTIVPPKSRTHPRHMRSREGSISMSKPPALVHNADSAPAALPRKPSVHPDAVPFIPADFVGTDFPVDTEQHTPFTLISLLTQLLAYHTVNVPDAQAATHFLLLLAPLLPQTHPLAQSEIDRTISAYSEHFVLLGYTDEEIYSLLQNTFESLIKAGLQPLYAESIISTYHEQLQQLGLFNNAAYLRRLSFPTYPAVYEQGLKDNAMNFMCGNCKKPINNPVNKFRCENCEQRQETCPICWCATSPFEAPAKPIAGTKTKKGKTESASEPQAIHHHNSVDTTDDIWHREEAVQAAAVASHAAGDQDAFDPSDLHKPMLYSTCLLCNHTAHTACLRAWHSPDASPQSEGLCPTMSCLCACTPGATRTSILEALDAQEAERRGSKASSVRPGQPTTPKVRDDEWIATTSQAAREAGNLMPVSPLPPATVSPMVQPQRRDRETTPLDQQQYQQQQQQQQQHQPRLGGRKSSNAIPTSAHGNDGRPHSQGNSSAHGGNNNNNNNNGNSKDGGGTRRRGKGGRNSDAR